MWKIFSKRIVFTASWHSPPHGIWWSWKTFDKIVLKFIKLYCATSKSNCINEVNVYIEYTSYLYDLGTKIFECDSYYIMCIFMNEIAFWIVHIFCFIVSPRKMFFEIFTKNIVKHQTVMRLTNFYKNAGKQRQAKDTVVSLLPSLLNISISIDFHLNCFLWMSNKRCVYQCVVKVKYIKRLSFK